VSAPSRSAWTYFLLVLLLSAPFWVLGAIVGQIPKEVLPIDLPVGALMTFAPMLAALILTYQRDGGAGARQLLLRAIDVRRVTGAGWFAVAALLMPAALVLEYAALRAFGAALPALEISIAAIVPFCLMFLVGAVGEELGWQGYVFPILRERWDALTASLILGTIWSVWHIVPLIQADRSAEWILWQCLMMLPLRVITVWLFVNAGQSVFVTVLFHAMGNVAQFLFPVYGSHYNPMATFVILAIAAAAIVVLWGATTLSRFPFGRGPG
jgi:membrane protease YdiL (CAAX protease family)